MKLYMLQIGCHLSSAKGYLHMAQEALAIDANTFQFFSRNPRGSRAKAVDQSDIAAYDSFVKAHRFAAPLAHAPYTLNPASVNPSVREFAQQVLEEDLQTLALLPGVPYNFHPGSHGGQGIETGVHWLTKLLNRVLRPERPALVLLETMSGKGSEIGKSFAELREIIDRIQLREQVGVCLDTCHVYSAGYDIVKDLDGVITEFDQIIGLEKLRAVHLNDSMHPLGSRKDRHARIGEGQIGAAALCRVIRHPALRELPFFLETPNELEGYAQEIEFLRTQYEKGDA